jgi:hypothetical protein
MAVALFAVATLAPIVLAAVALVLTDGLSRVVVVALAVVGLVNVMPFWPPLLRADSERVNEMVRKRTRRSA